MLTSVFACGGGTDGPTSSSGKLGLSGIAAVLSSDRRGGVLEAELLLDGKRVDSRAFQPAETGVVFLQVSDVFIAPGAHTLSVKMVKQVTSPTFWDVQIGAAVVNLGTLATQEFNLPEDIRTVSLANGQVTTLEFTARP